MMIWKEIINKMSNEEQLEFEKEFFEANSKSFYDVHIRDEFESIRQFIESWFCYELEYFEKWEEYWENVIRKCENTFLFIS